MRRIIPERYGRGAVRALVVSNMLPDAAHPERGRFVRDQVAALRRLEGLDVELYEFAPGGRELARAALDLRRAFRRPPSGGFAGPPDQAPAVSHAPQNTSAPFDVVHAHFGLSVWPSLAIPARIRALTVHGTDLHHGRTRLATRAALPLIDLLAAASAQLARDLPGRRAQGRARVLPCGVDLERFRPLPRAFARAELGLDGEKPYLLFPSDPARPYKRHDRALALASAAGVELLALGGVDPLRVPLWVNAANAVLVPSDREGFGLAVLEALACEVPVLATPVGIHADALEGIDGSYCSPFNLGRWRAALEEHLRDGERPGIGGRSAARASARRFSADAMAERVAAAWRMTLEQAG